MSAQDEPPLPIWVLFRGCCNWSGRVVLYNTAMTNQASIVDDLLGGLHSEETARQHLEPAGFSDWRWAYREIQLLASGAERRKAVEHFLPHLLASFGSDR